MFNGAIIKESLAEEDILENLPVVKTEVEDIRNPAPDQPSQWHLFYFEIPEQDADAWAHRFSGALRNGTWYIDFKNEKEIYVVFAEKIFHYQRGDVASHAEAQAYGRSLGLPEKQLAWSE